MLLATRDVTARYSSLAAWGYDRFVGRAAARQTLPTLHHLLAELPADAYVLDLGCGGGQLLVEIAKAYPALRLAGIDLSPQQVARARKRTMPVRERVAVLEGSATSLPLGAGTFDLVISVASVKHWPDPLQGLRELLRVLRPGGRLHVVEVFAGCSVGDVQAFIETLPIPRILHRLVVPRLRRLLQTGWTVEHARWISSQLALEDAAVECRSRPPVVVLSGARPVE